MQEHSLSTCRWHLIDLQRIRLYLEKGFQIYQEIPDEVWETYERLVRLGFDKHLVKEGN